MELTSNKLKNYLRHSSALIVILILSLNGCKKDRGIRITEPAENLTSKQDIKLYLNKKLNEYGKIIVILAQNPAVQKLVNERVALKFDGDYNVLLNELVKPESSDMISLKKSLSMSNTPSPASPGGPAQSVNLQALEQALTQPLQVNGETLQPQIYIPFFEAF